MNSRIMVLDDEPQIRQSLLKLLRAEGYEVALAANGQEALERFDRENIDLLLLDFNLPLKSACHSYFSPEGVLSGCRTSSVSCSLQWMGD